MLLMFRKYRDSDGEAAAPCPVLLTIHISPHQAVRALHLYSSVIHQSFPMILGITHG